MAKLTLIFGLLLVIVNTILGMLISGYPPLNWISVNVVLLINTLLLYKISISQINDGFKISLCFIFSFLGMISSVLATLSSEKWKDNFCLIGVVLILFIEIAFYIITKNLKFINIKK